MGFERKDVGFDDFSVGVIEAGVDEVGRFAGLGLDAAAENGEGALGGFGRVEDVGAGAEDGGAGGADRESRVEAGGQDGWTLRSWLLTPRLYRDSLPMR